MFILMYYNLKYIESPIVSPRMFNLSLIKSLSLIPSLFGIQGTKEHVKGDMGKHQTSAEVGTLCKTTGL